MLKSIIQKKLERAVKKYFKRNPSVKLVAVVGSSGKTSTKVAIGTVLNEKFKIRLHEGNHNSELSAPLAILGVEFPDNIRSISQWLTVFKAIKTRLHSPDKVEVIVQELGTDAVGQIPHFGKYLKPDIAIITSVTAEHIEFFKSIDAVATEELSAANFSEKVLINRDDIDGKYAEGITNAELNTYGISEQAEYRFESEGYNFKDGFVGKFISPEFQSPLHVSLKLVGEHSLKAAVAAGAVGAKLGLSAEQITNGMSKIQAVKGRMNLLRGVMDSTIIDDAYNSNPLSASAALSALYQIDAPQRIAVLGSMNELGDISDAEHINLGKLCDSSLLDFVVTVGEQAAKFIAPEAQKKGCQVRSFKTSPEAGAFVHQILKPGAVVLFKGSQGDIYLEEAIKLILHSTADEEQLVRQSAVWLEKKRSFFNLV